MNYRCSVLLFSCLCVALTGCQTQSLKDTDSKIIPKDKWATFNKMQSQQFKLTDFWSDISIKTMDGSRRISTTKTNTINCFEKICRLHPGRHTMEIEYLWSKNETVKDRQAKEVADIALEVSYGIASAFTLGLLEDIYIPTNENTSCTSEIEFDVQPSQEYILKINHSENDKQPEQVQILDVNSGLVIAEAPCTINYETADSFSNQVVPDDKCVLHIFVERDLLFVTTFIMHIDNSHPYHARPGDAYSLQVDAGEHQINVGTGPFPSWYRWTRNTSISIRCNAGEVKYLLIKFIGFSKKPVPAEISYEEALPMIKYFEAKHLKKQM